MKNFNDYFIHEIKMIYDAECQLVKALPELAKAAHSKELKEAFWKHAEETRHHVTRLEKIAKVLGMDLKHVSENHVIKLFIEEAHKLIKANYPKDVHDAALIAHAQLVEHYEISSYGTLKAFAKRLDFKDIEKILDETLGEEGEADKKLTSIAMGSLFHAGVNKKAINE